MKMSWRRVIGTVIVVLAATRCFVVWIEVCKNENIQDIGHRQQQKTTISHLWTDRKLAVVVPVHKGDKERAIKSLQKWPSKCHPLTVQNVDLVIYQAENSTDEVDLLAHVAQGPARCFRMASVVSANVLPEDNVYPKGASVQFYKMFLDPFVRKHFVKYDALAILEWDMILTHDSSFERLYKASFLTSEPFWVKGSTLSGNEFLETASLPENWHILGHLNGNAIYNNTDPAFIEFVNYTLSRWGFTYSYDVALWATISDFPYSWPLWQRYASRFVATNLQLVYVFKEIFEVRLTGNRIKVRTISNVGFHDVSVQDVNSALAVDTMFIHGSTRSLGSISNEITRRINDHVNYVGCTPACGSRDEVEDYLGLSTFCDETTCSSHDYPAGSIFERFGCGVGNPSKFGPACRPCIDESREVLNRDHMGFQQSSNLLVPNMGVVLCRKKTPLESVSCTQQCSDHLDTICDSRCGDVWYGDFNCNWRGMGENCRFCFHDIFAARLADKVARTIGGRVVMCNTHEPPLSDEDIKNLTQGKVTVDLQYSKEGSTGRMRSLSTNLGASGIHQKLAARLDPSVTEFAPNITLDQLCVFIPGHPDFHHNTDVSVWSIQAFMPGVRVVVATHPANFDAYNSTLRQALGVSIVRFHHVQFAAVEADRACGNKTRLILYMAPGDMLSRSFTSKDTHSPAGDLLVMYSGVEEVSQAHAKRTLASALVLGFHPPSFTFGTDLLLPVEANGQLRTKLVPIGLSQNFQDIKSKGEVSYVQVIESIQQLIPSERKLDVSIYIPELLAAVAFLHNLDGVRFVNMRHWNSKHIFKETSIWDVPLIKPRFCCTIDTSLYLESDNIANELRKWVAAFIRGARCERGFISHIPIP